MLPAGALAGLTALMDQLTVWLEVAVTVAVNCFCWLALKLTLDGLTVTASEMVVLPPKNAPLMVALLPPVRATLISRVRKGSKSGRCRCGTEKRFWCPAQHRYWRPGFERFPLSWCYPNPRRIAQTDGYCRR